MFYKINQHVIDQKLRITTQLWFAQMI